jgi:hypothetical protein
MCHEFLEPEAEVSMNDVDFMSEDDPRYDDDLYSG